MTCRDCGYGGSLDSDTTETWVGSRVVRKRVDYCPECGEVQGVSV